jgi:hypothetical protein
LTSPKTHELEEKDSVSYDKYNYVHGVCKRNDPSNVSFKCQATDKLSDSDEEDMTEDERLT